MLYSAAIGIVIGIVCWYLMSSVLNLASYLIQKVLAQLSPYDTTSCDGLLPKACRKAAAYIPKELKIIPAVRRQAAPRAAAASMVSYTKKIRDMIRVRYPDLAEEVLMSATGPESILTRKADMLSWTPAIQEAYAGYLAAKYSLPGSITQQLTVASDLEDSYNMLCAEARIDEAGKAYQDMKDLVPEIMFVECAAVLIRKGRPLSKIHTYILASAKIIGTQDHLAIYKYMSEQAGDPHMWLALRLRAMDA